MPEASGFSRQEFETHVKVTPPTASLLRGCFTHEA